MPISKLRIWALLTRYNSGECNAELSPPNQNVHILAKFAIARLFDVYRVKTLPVSDLRIGAYLASYNRSALHDVSEV